MLMLLITTEFRVDVTVMTRHVFDCRVIFSLNSFSLADSCRSWRWLDAGEKVGWSVGMCCRPTCQYVMQVV